MIETIYTAFMDPAALLAWLPPVPMTGKIHAFDARVGGGYEMSLFYPPEERTLRGKTADREDRASVCFLELTPPHGIVEAVWFHSGDPTFAGEMTVTWTFDAVAGGTEVTVLCENLPPGLRAEDNEAGRGDRWSSWRGGWNADSARLADRVRPAPSPGDRPRRGRLPPSPARGEGSVRVASVHAHIPLMLLIQCRAEVEAALHGVRKG